MDIIIRKLIVEFSPQHCVPVIAIFRPFNNFPLFWTNMKVLLAFQISFSSKEYVGFTYVLPCMTYVCSFHAWCSSLEPPCGVFYKTQWAWQVVKLTRLMSMFTSKKVWKFLIKNSADKIWFKIEKEIKVLPLMPIRVKTKYCKENNRLALLSSWISCFYQKGY